MKLPRLSECEWVRLDWQGMVVHHMPGGCQGTLGHSVCLCICLCLRLHGMPVVALLPQIEMAFPGHPEHARVTAEETQCRIVTSLIW